FPYTTLFRSSVRRCCLDFSRGRPVATGVYLPPLSSGPPSSPASWFWQCSLQSSCVRLSFHSPCPDIAASFSAFARGRRGGMPQRSDLLADRVCYRLGGRRWSGSAAPHVDSEQFRSPNLP